jgi:large-conductance mechanosensitive channel
MIYIVILAILIFSIIAIVNQYNKQKAAEKNWESFKKRYPGSDKNRELSDAEDILD